VATIGHFPSFFTAGTSCRADARFFCRKKLVHLAINKVWVLADSGIFENPTAPARKTLPAILKMTMEENENKPDSNVKSTIDAVTGLVKQIPIYQDTLQPSAKQVGQSLETVTKTVNIALAPIKALVWGYEKIEEFIVDSVSKKLKNVSKENILSPPPQVAGPAVEALRFTGHDPNLRELYANLLATAMDKETAHKAHPGFIEIIKNMVADEAIIMQCFISQLEYPIMDINASLKNGLKGYTTEFANYSNLDKACTVQRPGLLPNYIDNLCRLGLLEIPPAVKLITPGTYDPLENDPDVLEFKQKIEQDGRTVSFLHKFVQITTFGRQFIESVVIAKD